MRIVEPAARQARPDALPQDLQRLRTHAPSDRGSRAFSPSSHNVLTADEAARGRARCRRLLDAAGRATCAAETSLHLISPFPLNRWMDGSGAHTRLGRATAPPHTATDVHLRLPRLPSASGPRANEGTKCHCATFDHSLAIKLSASSYRC